LFDRVKVLFNNPASKRFFEPEKFKVKPSAKVITIKPSVNVIC
jgi:hypothetical protein